MKLVFQTSSRNCPFRHRNGQAVDIGDVLHGRFVRRARRYSPIFMVIGREGRTWPAFADELVIVP